MFITLSIHKQRTIITQAFPQLDEVRLIDQTCIKNFPSDNETSPVKMLPKAGFD